MRRTGLPSANRDDAPLGAFVADCIRASCCRRWPRTVPLRLGAAQRPKPFRGRHTSRIAVLLAFLSRRTEGNFATRRKAPGESAATDEGRCRTLAA